MATKSELHAVNHYISTGKIVPLSSKHTAKDILRYMNDDRVLDSSLQKLMIEEYIFIEFEDLNCNQWSSIDRSLDELRQKIVMAIKLYKNIDDYTIKQCEIASNGVRVLVQHYENAVQYSSRQSTVKSLQYYKQFVDMVKEFDVNLHTEYLKLHKIFGVKS